MKRILVNFYLMEEVLFGVIKLIVNRLYVILAI